MQTKNIIIIVALVVVLVGAAFVFSRTPSENKSANVNPVENIPEATAITPIVAPTPTPATPEGSSTPHAVSPSVKKFTMTSFFVMEDGKPHPQFSVKDMSVKKGDTVEINVTNTKGMHDFNIDEYNVHQKTPLDQEVTISFTADKVGDFVYYCAMPNHRQNGHWGTLHVTE